MSIRSSLAGASSVLVAFSMVGVVGAPSATAAYPGLNERIAYVSIRAGGPPEGQSEIFTIEPDGTRKRRLTDNEVNDFAPAYSPDGTRIAFELEVGGLDGELFVMETDGTHVWRLTNNDCDDRGPTWAPSGGRLAYSSDCEDPGIRHIWKIRLSDGDAEQLTDHDFLQDVLPAWSMMGEIAFQRADGGELHIWRIDADGSGEVQLTSGPVIDQNPSWSADGRFIAFDRLTDRFQIWRMRRGGGDAVNLSDHAASDSDPAWAPNNRRIAFSRRAPGPTSIFVMLADGGAGVEVTADGRTNFHPDWQPMSPIARPH